MDNYILYSISIILLLVSFIKNKKKTFMALKKAWKSFENILPELISVIVLVGIIMAFLNPQLVAKVLGKESGWFGVIIAAAIGSITLIPGFIAFPMAAIVLQNGAGSMQVAAFVSTLMMVGIITLPVEIKYFGKKSAFWRNGLAFIFSILVAFIIGKVVI